MINYWTSPHKVCPGPTHTGWRLGPGLRIYPFLATGFRLPIRGFGFPVLYSHLTIPVIRRIVLGHGFRWVRCTARYSPRGWCLFAAKLRGHHPYPFSIVGLLFSIVGLLFGLSFCHYYCSVPTQRFALRAEGWPMLTTLEPGVSTTGALKPVDTNVWHRVTSYLKVYL